MDGNRIAARRPAFRSPARTTGPGTALLVAHEAVPGKGEDSYAYLLRKGDALLAAFDGCGGLGAQRYGAFDGQTGAFVAARMAAAAVMDWFSRREPLKDLPQAEPPVLEEVRAVLKAQMTRIRRGANEASALRGSMVRSFPTTAAIALADCSRQDGFDALFLWAGDSRGYLLTPSGLRQLTRDELRGGPDAFENLYADAPLSNSVNADDEITLSARAVRAPYPAVLFVATDGAFGYVPSPMQFEMLLLEALEEAQSPKAWEDALARRLAALAGDDATLVMAILGWSDFEALRRDFAPRRDALRRLLPDAARSEDRAVLEAVWADYRRDYYA